jgi:hypothetical protein
MFFLMVAGELEPARHSASLSLCYLFDTSQSTERESDRQFTQAFEFWQSTAR